MAGLVTGIVGLGITAGTTAASFIQAGNQKRKQQDFEADAAKALAEARQRLQVNYAEAMSVNKEPYNQERLAMLSAGAQIAQAAAESKRGAGAVAGQLLASQQAGQQDISNRQGVDMQNIQNAILEEESRLRDVNVGLDVQELAGNQQAAADARLASQMAKQQGIQGIANFAQQGLQMIPLFTPQSMGNAAGTLTQGPKTENAPIAPSMIDPNKPPVDAITNPFGAGLVGPPAPQNPDDEFTFDPDTKAWSRKGYVWNSTTNKWEKIDTNYVLTDKGKAMNQPFVPKGIFQ
jgi:hypothetical protein